LAAPLDESIKWGHLVYQSNGPVLLIRAEARRVLFGFWRGTLHRAAAGARREVRARHDDAAGGHLDRSRGGGTAGEGGREAQPDARQSATGGRLAVPRSPDADQA